MGSRARVPVATKAQISLDAQAIDKVNRITGGKQEASVGVREGEGIRLKVGASYRFVVLTCNLILTSSKMMLQVKKETAIVGSSLRCSAFFIYLMTKRDLPTPEKQ